jgi:hypothetical protein
VGWVVGWVLGWKFAFPCDKKISFSEFGLRLASKRYFGNKVSVGAQMVIVLKALVEHCVSLPLGHPFDFSWLDVSQTDVFHRFLLVSCDSLFGVTQEP